MLEPRAVEAVTLVRERAIRDLDDRVDDEVRDDRPVGCRDDLLLRDEPLGRHDDLPGRCGQLGIHVRRPVDLRVSLRVRAVDVDQRHVGDQSRDETETLAREWTDELTRGRGRQQVAPEE